jgi:hypothetical protein
VFSVRGAGGGGWGAQGGEAPLTPGRDGDLQFTVYRTASPASRLARPLSPRGVEVERGWALQLSRGHWAPTTARHSLL